jgi:hypothetical protein
MVMPLGLEEAGRDEHLELGGKLLHRKHRRMLGDGQGAAEMALVLGPAEIMALEQLGREDQLRAARGRLAHEIGDRGDILLGAVSEGELQSGDGELGHGVLR